MGDFFSQFCKFFISGFTYRDLLYTVEKQRIILKRISPVHRLFHFSGTSSETVEELEIERPNYGQQDCKDFFICIEENKDCWSDIYDLLKFSMKCSTLCTTCQQVSESVDSSESQSMLMLQCPQERLFRFTLSSWKF